MAQRKRQCVLVLAAAKMVSCTICLGLIRKGQPHYALRTKTTTAFVCGQCADALRDTDTTDPTR